MIFEGEKGGLPDRFKAQLKAKDEESGEKFESHSAQFTAHAAHFVCKDRRDFGIPSIYDED